MSEIADLTAVLAGLDRVARAAESEAPRGQLAALVPAYRDANRFGWADAFGGREHTGNLPTFDEALRNLATTPTRFPTMLPRRLLVVALLARTMPERFGPGGDERELLVRALALPGISPHLPLLPTPPADEPPESSGVADPAVALTTQHLLEALEDPERLGSIEDWHMFLADAEGAGIVSAQLATLARPCTTTVIEQDHPRGPIAVLQTTLCVTDVAFADVAAFLDAAHWPRCSPWWCRMLPAGGAGGLQRFLEVVAIECDVPIFEVAVFLDFATAIDLPDRKVVTYSLSRNQGGSVGGRFANGAVDVDRGVIDVRQESDHIHVETTKRIRFTELVDTDTLAVLACVLGYGEIGADVVCDCSGGRPRVIACPEPFVLPPGAGPLGEAVDRLATLAQECTALAGGEARRVAERLDSGAYGPGAAVQDLSRAAALSVRGGAKLLRTLVGVLQDLSRPDPTSTTVETRPFPLWLTRPETGSLALTGDLVSPHGDVMPRDRVTIRPAELQGGGEFRLFAEVSGLEGSAYTGLVTATSLLNGLQIASVEVDVIVP
jgi:hypothetical protein